LRRACFALSLIILAAAPLDRAQTIVTHSAGGLRVSTVHGFYTKAILPAVNRPLPILAWAVPIRLAQNTSHPRALKSFGFAPL